MKKVSTILKSYVLIVLMMIFVGFSSFASIERLSKKKVKARLVGVWELVSFGNDDPDQQQARLGQLKVFDQDGSYTFLQVGSSGTVVAHQGTFRVKSDSTYVEDIEFATRQNLRGVSSTVSYKFTSEEEVLVHGNVGDIIFHEKWRKVKLPRD